MKRRHFLKAIAGVPLVAILPAAKTDFSDIVWEPAGEPIQDIEYAIFTDGLGSWGMVRKKVSIEELMEMY